MHQSVGVGFLRGRNRRERNDFGGPEVTLMLGYLLKECQNPFPRFHSLSEKMRL